MSITEIVMNKISEAKRISFKQPSLAFDMSKDAYNTAKANGLKLEEAHALFAMALACRSMTKLNDCLNYALDAYKLYKIYNDSLGLAGSLNLIGIVYFYNAFYDRSLEYFLKALHFLKETEDYIIMSRIFNNLGEVYREVENFDEALISYKNALDLCEKHNYMTNAAVILENMGDIYFRKEDYKYSKECYKKSYDILIKYDDVTALSELEGRMGKIHFVQKEYDKARACYVNALAKLDEIDNKYFSIDILIDLAKLEMIENDELFLFYLVKAVKYGEELNARKKLSQIYKMLTEFYEKKFDYQSSLEFYKRYHAIEQEIETSVISHRLEIIKIELNALFSGEEVDKITKLNRQLEQDIANQNKLLDAMEKTNRNLSVEVLSDELTQIPNRRSVNNHFAQVWKEGELTPFHSALLMMDIDHFKRYNDFHGHLEGDICLKKIATCLKYVFANNNGILGRFGGEEFVCFVKDTDYENVLKLAELFRSSIEKLDMSYFWNNAYYPVTISIGGVFGCNKDFNSVEDMYAIADKELYHAKNQGRNNVKLQNITK
jgi:diguanylate cyclase (GGDEF)-like protein